MYDVVVVGGGIVGLATAYKLLQRRPGTSLLVLEKERELALHQSSHNSGVVHSGIYYRPGSLKATICRRGVSELTRFCREEGLPLELCGKVIVATEDDERPRLHALLERGRANGVPGLRLVSRDELAELEPHAAGVEALHSPETGIVSFGAVAAQLGERVRQRGTIRTDAELLSARRDGSRLRLSTRAGEVLARRVVTCAGLHADRVARLFGEPPPVRIVPFRGEYRRLRAERRGLVRNLIYPVPDPRFPFLGVHLTRTIDGEVEAGPNAVLALAREGYRKTDIDAADLWEQLRFPGFWRMGRRHWRMAVSEYRRSLSTALFLRDLKKLVPELRKEDLEPGGAGVRAMALERDGTLVDDFRIWEHGDVLHVLSAPSPAATSALAIGDHIVGMLC